MNKSRIIKIRGFVPALAIGIIVVLGVILAVLVLVTPYTNDKNGIKQEDSPVDYEIVLNSTAADVSAELEQMGVIKSDSYFIRWVQKNHPDFTYNPGIYSLNSNMSYEELITAFENPTVDRSLVKVCIPEGKRIVDIAELMEENGICSASDFIEAQDNDTFDYDFVTALDNVDKRGYRLEGYLFPATYDLQRNSEAHDVVNTMLLAFSYRVESNDWQEKCDKFGITLDDAVTLGSILEAEASGASADDMANVSSVFWNRLNSSQFSHLQSDPTVFYADLLEENGFSRSIWKGYSTYSCEGLPTGAVNCPGEVAVNAALAPAKSDYYYFFTYEKSDGGYGYTFASDYSDFVAKAKKAGVL